MSDVSPLTDEAVLKDLAQRLSRHRVHHNLTQAQLAYEAGVSKRTVERMEAGHSTQLSSFIRILRVLELLPQLNQLIGEAPASPIAQLRNEKKTRRRASSPRPKADRPKADSHSRSKVDRHSSHNPGPKPRPKAHPKPDSHSEADRPKADSHSRSKADRHSSHNPRPKPDSHSEAVNTKTNTKTDRHSDTQYQSDSRADQHDDADRAHEDADKSRDASAEPNGQQTKMDDPGRKRRVPWRWDDES